MLRINTLLLTMIVLSVSACAILSPVAPTLASPTASAPHTPTLVPNATERPVATSQPTDTTAPPPATDNPPPTIAHTSTPTPEPTIAPTPIQVTPGSFEVVYHQGEFELKGFLCIPEGTAPFPAAVYNHGGLGDQIGGAPAETCEALAQAGFVGFSPIRRQTRPLAGHLDDVLAGVNYVKSLDYVDENRLALMGFSRGGMLTFMAATARPKDFKAIIIMASAIEILDNHLSQASKISAPVLLLISENDNARQNHVHAMQELRAALEAAGKEVRFILYPPYQNDGHRMFFEVGAYWADVQQFLHEHLQKN